jgi:hypothetical protein
VATIGKVVAVLTARTAPFRKGMMAAGKRMRAFGGGLVKAGAKVAKFGAALGAVAIGGLALIVRHQLAAIDTLAKLGRNLGVATEKLQAMRLAASIAGVDSDKLDKGLKKLTKSVSDATAGLSTQVRAFKNLGISVEQLQGLTIDETFKLVAEQVKLVGASAQTTGAIMDIFGTKIGADLVNLLQQGRAGVEAFEKEIQDLGLALTAVDAAKVEAANDAWTRFKAILSGVAQKITVELAPFLEAAITKIVELGKQGQGMGGFIVSAVEMVAKALGVLANIVQSVRAAWLLLRAAVVSVAEFAIRGIVKVVEALGWLLDKLGIVDTAWTESFTLFADGMKQVGQEARDEAGKALNDLGRNRWGDKLVDTFDDIRRKAQEAAEETSKIAEQGKGIETAVEPAVKKVKDLKKEIETTVAPKGAGAVREFREADLATLGIGGKPRAEKAANEATQKVIADLLKRMKEIMENPKPVPLIWS